VQNVDAIAAVRGVDGLFVGPGDLGLRLGRMTTDMTVESAFQATADACKKHGKAWGTPVPTQADLVKRRQQGGQLLNHGGDFITIMRALEEAASHYAT